MPQEKGRGSARDPELLLVDEHPVYRGEHLPGGGDRRHLPPLLPSDAEEEAGELRVRFVADVDMHRLGEDPSQVARALLADAAIVCYVRRLVHARHQPRVRT